MIYTVNGVSFDMVLVEGGTFQMGSNDRIWCRAEHQVTLSDYYIGKTEVTQELWQAVLGNNPSNFYTGSKYPVHNVSWNDCQEFIHKLNNLTGENFRLPTEAEWEFASRGGKKSRGYIYSGSDNIDDVAWYCENYQQKGGIMVATKLPNELGLYDMSGNVKEWCSDWWCDEFSSLPQINPKGPSNGNKRVVRGGTAGSCAQMCFHTERYSYEPNEYNILLGLRLAQ